VERITRKRAEAEANLKASLPRTVLPNDVVAAEAQTSTSNIAAQTSEVQSSMPSDMIADVATSVYDAPVDLPMYDFGL